MRGRLILIVLLISIGVGGWWFWKSESSSRLKNRVMQYVENSELVTLEAQYSPEFIMEQHHGDLLPDAQHSFKEVTLKYYPYLLIEAKYTQSDKKTREGPLLWGMVDGEMVIDTENWDQTHGFEDAMRANATRTDLKVMQLLAKNGGACSRDQLQQDLHLEAETLEPWIDSVRQKQLVVQSGTDLYLHIEDPIILVAPQTKIKQVFVTKAYRYHQCVGAKYNRSQIEKTAQAAFGPTFTIRNVKEVYLPVYGISVSNPDGSNHTSYWNAISGQRLASLPD